LETPGNLTARKLLSMARLNNATFRDSIIQVQSCCPTAPTCAFRWGNAECQRRRTGGGSARRCLPMVDTTTASVQIGPRGRPSATGRDGVDAACPPGMKDGVQPISAVSRTFAKHPPGSLPGCDIAAPLWRSLPRGPGSVAPDP
jgi:hypothetical protein